MNQSLVQKVEVALPFPLKWPHCTQQAQIKICFSCPVRMEQPQDSNGGSSDSNEQLFHFAYGPVVIDLVRKRRGIAVEHIQPAFLPEYRLTFVIGGMANIVPRRGYEVHSLLMKLASLGDWERVQKCDAGSTPSSHTVTPYDKAGNEGEPVNARLVEFSDEVDDEFLDSPVEILPQCRYLEMIAAGMRAHGVDDDYMQDQIMAVPLAPKRTPEDYQQVPRDPKLLASSKVSLLRSSTSSSRSSANSATTSPALPQISFQKDIKLCLKQPAVGGDLFFILDDAVFRVQQPEIDRVLAVKWFKTHGHGKPVLALLIHKLVVDPDIPLCDELNQMTNLHFAWAYNHVVESLIVKYQVTKVAMLKLNGKGEDFDGIDHRISASSSVFLRTVKRTSKRFSLNKGTNKK